MLLLQGRVAKEIQKNLAKEIQNSGAQEVLKKLANEIQRGVAKEILVPCVRWPDQLPVSYHGRLPTPALLTAASLPI